MVRALWLLPDYPVFPRGQYGNWAASGEIDVMENRGGAREFYRLRLQ